MGTHVPMIPIVTTQFRPALFYHILFPLLSLSFSTGIKCPVCSKFVMPDDIECHLVMCLTKPRLSYNGKLLLLVGWLVATATPAAGWPPPGDWLARPQNDDRL